MIAKSGSCRASTAARIFCTISSMGMTCLPSIWPHFLGQTWSSICSPATTRSGPASSSLNRLVTRIAKSFTHKKCRDGAYPIWHNYMIHRVANEEDMEDNPFMKHVYSQKGFPGMHATALTQVQTDACTA